ncbi:hypothetical protein ACJJTC_015454 [Scirpophaga incertulas]
MDKCTRSASSDGDVPLRPTNELDKRVQLVTRLMERGCNCGATCDPPPHRAQAGRGPLPHRGPQRLLKGRHMMVRVGGGWDTLEPLPVAPRALPGAPRHLHFHLHLHLQHHVALSLPLSTLYLTPTLTLLTVTPTTAKPSSGKTTPNPSKPTSGKIHSKS